MKKHLTHVSLVAVFAVLAAFNVGCVKPYHEADLQTIEPNETAFLIPLEGSLSDQVKFDSEEQLNKLKVASKRVEIPHRWKKTSRMPNVGKWIPTVRLITVNRSPVAQRWTTDEASGTSREIQALEAESRDSIGIMSGFAITAFITEEDAAKYLYHFPAKDLAIVIDNQIFNAAQAIYTEWAAGYNLSELRSKKSEITEKMRSEMIPHFAKMGITINPTMGIIGGLAYEDKEIQVAINDVFVAQTKEAGKEAERLAQLKENERVISVEETDAAQRRIKADAEAYEISQKAKAVRDGGKEYIQLLTLENDAKRIAKWDGSVPSVQGGEGVSTHVLRGLGGSGIGGPLAAIK